MIDVLCTGMATWDLTMEVDYQPGADEKCFAEEFRQCGGGPAANAAYTVAMLGGTSAFSGYLGDDVFGKAHLSEFLKASVNVDGIVQGKSPTALSFILAKPDGKRTVVTHRKTEPIPADRKILEKIWSTQPRAILFDGHERVLSVALAQKARERQTPVLLDAGSVHPGILNLLKYADYLVTSRKFAFEFTQTRKPEEALRKLKNFAEIVVITLGEKGLVWKSAKASGELPAFTISPVDTTGAGDIFHGAFALGIVRGRELEENLLFSSAAAAIACEKIGARLGCPTRAAVNAFLRKRKNDSFS